MTALLLTATIAPAADAANHSQFDPAERLAQYEDALRFYLAAEGPAWKILFVDNSGHPLDTLRAVAAERTDPARPVRFLSYRSEVPAAWGKGRGEVGLIETALNHFRDLLDPDEPVWKITGRLKVLNISRLVTTQPAQFRVYADFRDVPLIGDALGGNRWVDTRLIAFTPEGYRDYILQKWPDARFTVEKRMFQTLRPHLGPGSGIVPRFRVQPRVSGTSGGSGRNYNGTISRAKTALRSSMRLIAPGLWI